MSALVVIEYTSLDGVLQAPGHEAEDTDGGFQHGGWTGPFMAEHRRYITEALLGAGGFLLGRRTYEIFSEYWPTVTDPADHIARMLNTRPKYVVSTTLRDPAWEGTTVVAGGEPGALAAAIDRLKQQPGGPIYVVGSTMLARTLHEHGLVDEYQLWLHPVVLGGGKRLFPDDGRARQLHLVDCRTTGSGLVILTYTTAGEPA
jgi:dihydrofolate reductase